MRSVAGMLSAAVLGLAVVAAAQRPDELEDAGVRAHYARRVFLDNCLICHGAEMTTRQRLTPAQWQAVVEKMIGWGAPVPPEQVGELTAWLSAAYPVERPLEPAPLVPVERLRGSDQPEPGAWAAPAGDVAAGARLHAEHCAWCHGPTGQGGDLGPNLVERPILLRPSEWEAVVREGRNRMPGYRLILTPEQERAVLAWLRQRRYEP